jgi:hypothetical protein
VSPRFPLRPDPVEEEAAESRSGLAVSAVFHLVLFAFVVFGGPIFDSDDEAQALRLAPVETITAAEFDAMVSSAPEAPADAVPAPLPPGGAADAPESPEAPAAADRPEAADAPDEAAPEAPPSAAEAPSPRPDPSPIARPDAPAAPDAPPSPPSGVTLSGQPLPAGPDRPDAPQRDAPVVPDAAPPREADRIAPVPAPDSPALPEAETARPETRPADEPAETAEAPEEPAAAVTGVRDAVSGFWNTAQVLRLERYEELVVTVYVPLGPDGKLAGGAGGVRTDPASPPDGRWKIAVDAARRAAIRAASAGFDLPPESYERWKTLELVFKPGSDFAGVQL